MPELPDLEVYREALARRVNGHRLEQVVLLTPFLLRTVDPPLAAVEGSGVVAVSRLGKRLVLELDGERFLALHLMIAGRLHWRAPGDRPLGRKPLARFRFDTGELALTEAGTRRRAALHCLAGREALAALDRGGLEVLSAGPAEFAAALRRANHTVKRALTDPRLVSGVGNAFSDEILHAARLSPFQQTGRMSDEELVTLHRVAVEVLTRWTARLRSEAGDRFPENVTAFREGMAVHGRFGKPCPDCGAPVQRIRYAGHETNYCARCQTGGRLLADRALSRLLKADWPRTLEDLE